MAIIRKIENSILEFYKDHWIIWKSHNKDFTQGTYYKLNNDGTVDLVIEDFDNVQIIQNIHSANGD